MHYHHNPCDPHKDEVEHFIKCETCGGWIDCRDLGSVFDHEGPHSTGLERAFGEPAPLQPEYRDHLRLDFFVYEGHYLAQRRATIRRRLNPEIVEPLPGLKLCSQPAWLFPAT
jgi:hypothetical protein